MSRGRRWTLFLLLAVAGVSAGYLASEWTGRKTPDVGAVDGLIWPGTPLPAFALETTDERPLDPDRLAGQWSLLFFGFTNCPDVCPTTLSGLAGAMDVLRDDGDLGDSQVYFVSVDPARDPLATIGKYVAAFDDAFVGATGSIEAIDQLARPLGVLHVRNEPDENGMYTVDHSAAIIVVDPDGRRVGILSTPHTPQEIARRFREIRGFVEAQG